MTGLLLFLAGLTGTMRSVQAQVLDQIVFGDTASETANAFENKVDTKDSSRFDAARKRLIEYRKSIEGDFVSSLSIITYYEANSWGNPR